MSASASNAQCKTNGVSESNAAPATTKPTWSVQTVTTLFDLPFNELLFRAQTVHRKHFDPNKVQLSTLISIKTGACPEDCKYCSQSGHHNTGLEVEPLIDVEAVVSAAKQAKANGATRFCMGAAWRSPTEKGMPSLIKMIESVKGLGLETCMTLGMLNQQQATRLADAGLDYYNHNLDTSSDYYRHIITTRSYQDRLDTLHHVRQAGMNVCSGGILGMGETRQDRMGLLLELANLPVTPESVPINLLVKIPGTPLEKTDDLDPLELVRTIAVARIIMPATWLRLSAGREEMSDSTQALCFFAGANSIFYGDQLLTTNNASVNKDQQLFAKLGIEMLTAEEQGAHEPVSCV